MNDTISKQIRLTVTMSTKVQKTIFSDWNIDSLLNVVGEKVSNLFLYLCLTFQSNSCDNISKNIIGCNVITFAWALSKWIPKPSMVCPY